MDAKDSLFKKEVEVVSKPLLTQLQSVEDALIQYESRESLVLFLLKNFGMFHHTVN